MLYKHLKYRTFEDKGRRKDSMLIQPRERPGMISFLEDWLEEVINKMVVKDVKERREYSKLEGRGLCASHEQSGCDQPGLARRQTANRWGFFWDLGKPPNWGTVGSGLKGDKKGTQVLNLETWI